MPYKDEQKQKEAQARYYSENKERLLKVQNNRRNLFLRKSQGIKSTMPCADCKIQYPHYVMDFDHVRGSKLYNIGTPSNASSMSNLEAEIAKCDVVCANCHRHRTFMRAGKKK